MVGRGSGRDHKRAARCDRVELFGMAFSRQKKRKHRRDNEKIGGLNCALMSVRPYEYCITPSLTLPKRRLTMSSA